MHSSKLAYKPTSVLRYGVNPTPSGDGNPPTIDAAELIGCEAVAKTGHGYTGNTWLGRTRIGAPRAVDG